jgi:hypothetical protein
MTDGDCGGGLSHGLMALTSLPSGHARVSPLLRVHGCGHIRPAGRTNTPLSSELWHCTAYPRLSRWSRPAAPGFAALAIAPQPMVATRRARLRRACDRSSSGSHFGSTLMPGRAVLTRGVFRRSGSVACVRADASPSEVLAGSNDANSSGPSQCGSRFSASAGARAPSRNRGPSRASRRGFRWAVVWRWCREGCAAPTRMTGWRSRPASAR